MNAHPEASVARIFANNGAIVGAGFLVADNQVVTCAHVVAQALKADFSSAAVSSEVIHLDFPLVALGDERTAHMLSWHPTQPDGGGDIAVLQLDSPPPAAVKCARLVTEEHLWGHLFRTYGFPSYHSNGIWASGRLLAREATGWVQIEDMKETGHRVQRGFSGSAVWDEQLDGVAGMVVATEAEEEAVTKTAYMILTDMLIKAWPPLGQQAIPACPYRGLFAFREQDAHFFFGRETITQHLVEAVRRKPLVAVVGSSGSGKSSVVFAGLLPHLRKEPGWLLTSFRPGEAPLRSLAAAVIPLLEPRMSEMDRRIEVNKMVRHLQQGDLTMPDIVDMVVQKHVAARFLIVIDQFEELYTLCPNGEEWHQFLDILLSAIHMPPRQGVFTCNIVLTLRADFVSQALTYRPFTDALQQADLKLGPMNPVELRAAINKPAEKLHIKLEKGLTERILNDVTQEAGNLPLLEFALTLLWSKQKEGKLTHAAYDEIGGVGKALADHAEEVYASLNEQQQWQAQRIFVQLVRPGEGTEDTRRLATRSDIGEENWRLVVRLADARLVVTSQDQASGEETVEVIHEALIRKWQRLHNWIDEDREFLAWHDRSRAALRQWKRSQYDEGALLRGAILVEALQWLTRYTGAITEEEQTFIRTSQQSEQQRIQRLQALLEESERQRFEAERQRTLAEERQREAEQHRQEAEAQRQEAQRQQQMALARGLAAQAELLRNQYPDLIERSVLLAIESVQRFQTPEADWIIRQGGAQLRRRLVSLTHNCIVDVVAFSPDGQLLATAGSVNVTSDNTTGAWKAVSCTTGVWEVASGRRLATLAHQADVRAVAFSPNGRLLAICRDKAASVWEVATGRPLATLTHQADVSTVAFSPDGHLLATASWDKTAGIWEVASGRRLVTLAHQADVYAIAFSPDGRLLATVSEDNIAGIWEVASGRRLATLGYQAGVRAVAFTPTGVQVVAFTPTGPPVLVLPAGWDKAANVQADVSGAGFTPNERMLAFNPDGRLLATAGWDKAANVWEVATGRLLATLAHQADVVAIAFSPDGRLLATGSVDKTAGIWEVASGRRLATLTHQGTVRAVAFSPDGRLLATAGWNKAANVWEVASGRRPPTLTLKNSVDAIALSPDGRLLATSNWGKTADVWEVASGRRLATLTYQDTVRAVAFSPDGRLLATVSVDKTAGIWEVASGRRLATLTHQGTVRYFGSAFSPDGHLLATVSVDKTADVWEIVSDHRLLTLAHNDLVNAVVFSPDGQLLATASANNIASLWEVASGRRLATLTHHGSVHAIAFSPDGHLLATGSEDKTAGIWEVASGRRLATLTHHGTVHAIAFSPDGHLLATASRDKTAGIWELTSGLQVVRLTHDKTVSEIAFSPDGRYLITVSSNVARVWFCRTQDVLADVESRLNRNLTPKEWKQYLGDEPYRKTFPNLP